MNKTNNPVVICCLLIPLVIGFFNINVTNDKPNQAQQAVCFWQLTGDTEAIAVAKSTTGASATREGNWIKTEQTLFANEGCSAPTLLTTHTWTQPASSLTPGETKKINVSASWELSGSASCTAASTGLHTSIRAGTTTVTTRRSSIILSKEPNGAIANSGSWVVPSGSKEGATLTISAGGDAAVAGGTVTYNYRYVCRTPTPTTTMTATKGTITPPTRTPTSTLTFTPTFTPTVTLTPQTTKKFPCDGKARNSGAIFSDLSGEVSIAPCSDPDDQRFAEWRMGIATGSIIKTESDSYAHISFADNTLFKMGSFTTVYIDMPPDSESKLSLLFGKVWANVQKMVKDGTMNVTMNQAVAGTKGTTFILEETGQVSKLKVLDGTVAFTSRTTGESLDIKAGQSISASASGLSAVVPIDIAREAAQWPETQGSENKIPPAAVQPNKDGFEISTWLGRLSIFCSAGLGLLAVVGIIAFFVVRSTK